MKTEYQVRPVTRFLVTRYAKNENGAASSTIGEFANGEQADNVADAMVAYDLALGVESTRSRHGLSLGEVISGQRLKPEGNAADPQLVSDEVLEAVRDKIAEALGEAMDCTRTWAAWGVGTMSQDDFTPVSEDAERINEIAIAALEAMGLKVAP